MEFIQNAEMISSLITGLIGLVCTAVSTYFALKHWAVSLETKKKQELWVMIMEVADKAMEEAERSGESGADKKTMVMDIVKASALAAGVDISDFVDQLSDYIDQTIAFFNKMQNR